jgi:hypothetical protein
VNRRPSYLDRHNLVFPHGRVRSTKPLPDTDTVQNFLARAQYLVRGLGRRHWISLAKTLVKERCPIDIIVHLRISFFKFKLLRMLDPENKRDILWIFKHCLTLAGQKRYKTLYESFIDVGGTESIFQLPRDHAEEYRIIDYFSNCEPDLVIPYSAFPPIYYEKDRMHLCFEELPKVDVEEVRGIFFRYLMQLNVREIFVPPPDILWKVGNQKFNDGCEVKTDFERATSYDSAFLVQEFLGGPLQPRQVWLPSKKVKNNNIFWMIVGRQFLKREPVYPREDPVENAELLKDLPHYMRFDISGFGLQYVRQYLSIIVQVIEEMYPSSNLMVFAEEARHIFDNVRVIMPSGKRESPPRGIGLGYYEDLKTLCMIAFLKPYKPFSVYGDQGLLPDEDMIWLQAIQEILGRGFIMKDDSIVLSSSDGSLAKRRVKWAGILISNTGYTIFKKYSSKIIQAFFLERHWERKAGLLSFAEEFPDFYATVQKRLLRLYSMLYGDEFYTGDSGTSFYDTGIMLKPITVGFKKDFRVSSHKVPFDPVLFEGGYTTPFKKVVVKSYPRGLSKSFELERKRLYRETPCIDSSIHYYVNPRIVLNNRYNPKHRVLPAWAEFLYALNYESTTGSFTYGLTQEQMESAIQTYSHHSDPFKAFASGGYKILDMWHCPSIPTQEDREAALYLSKLHARQLDYVRRADLPIHPSQREDKLYFSEDHSYEEEKFEKRLGKRKFTNFDRPSWGGQAGQDEDFKELVLKKINLGRITTVKDLVQENLIHEPTVTTDTIEDFGEDEILFDDDDIGIHDYDDVVGEL